MSSVSRRELLTLGLGATAAAALGEVRASEAPMASARVRYCLNTSTVRGQKLDLAALVDLAAKAGYDGIEPWMGEITAWRDAGGKLSDMKKRIADAGLAVESAIGFAEWIVDDPERRKAGLENAKSDMDLVAQLGGTRIAAPPAGATKEKMTDLAAIAERYAALCKVGEEVGVLPQLEVWGFSATLSRLGETSVRARRVRTFVGVSSARRVSHLQGWLAVRRTRDARRSGGACLPHERLSRPATAGNDRRLLPSLSGRWRRSARSHLEDDVRERV